MRQAIFGDIIIDRLIEVEGPGYAPNVFFPDATSEGFEGEMDWLLPNFWDVAAETYFRAIQSYVVRTPHHTVLVDACVGADKERPSSPAWHQMNSTWLNQLISTGIHPEEVDYVLCTHLHADHVGWNTRLENGRWVPTFPNAKYVFHKEEFRYWEKVGKNSGGQGSQDGCFVDSVLPVMAAKQAVLVEADFEIDNLFTLDPTPGHSPGHVCVNLNAREQHVVMSGDILHHPIQIAYPEWNSRFCIDPDRSRESRRSFVEKYADTGTLLLPAHFASPTMGRIVSNGIRCKYQLADS